jgi:hypothetical protein
MNHIGKISFLLAFLVSFISGPALAQEHTVVGLIPEGAKADYNGRQSG